MKLIRAVTIVAVLAACVLNAGHAARLYYHWPILQHDDLWYYEASLGHTREVIHRLGSTRIAYLSGPGVDVDYPGAFFEAQYLLTPVILRRDSPEGAFVLVNFGRGKPVAVMPGLVLAEDFKNGFALFRRQG